MLPCLLLAAAVLSGSASTAPAALDTAAGRREWGRLAGMVNGGHISQVEHVVQAPGDTTAGEPVPRKKIVWLHSGIRLLLRCAVCAWMPASC